MPRKGYKQTKEHIRKASKGRKGRSSSRKGKKLKPLETEHKMKIGKANKGKKRTEEQRRKIRELILQIWKDPNSSYHSKERSQKISKSMIGSKNSCWNNGSSFEPYTPEFNKILKNRIREKFNHQYIVCKNSANIPHHIDYSKKNNLENNFVLLCNSCNSKANFNRDQWETCFKIFIPRSIYKGV